MSRTRYSPNRVARLLIVAVATTVAACRLLVPSEPTPRILVARGTVAFTAVQGNLPPAPEVDSIRNGGDGQLGPLTIVGVTGDSGAATWLHASLSASSAPGALVVSVTPTTLPSGTYHGSIELSATGADNNPLTIQVLLTVLGPDPRVALSAVTIALTAVQGGANPAPAIVTVRNVGGGLLNGLYVGGLIYSIGASGWLSSTLASVTANPSTTLVLTPIIAGLTPGTYTVSVPIGSAAAANTPQSLVLTLKVVRPPTIVLTPTMLSISAVQGSPAPAPQAVGITNGGDSLLTALAVGTTAYGAGEPTGWLQSTLTAAANGGTLSVQSLTASLPPGTYHASISISSPVAANNPQAIAVTLSVTADPRIALTPTPVLLNAARGGPNPAPVTVAVTNSGSGGLTNLGVGPVTYTGTGGWLTASLAGNTAPTTLSLSANIGSLIPGPYSATVQVTSPVANNSPQTLAVTLNVAEGPVDGPGTPGLSFTHVPAMGSVTDSVVSGRITHAIPSDYEILTYVLVAGLWYEKPFSNAPVTTIASDGSWAVRIVTGGNDIDGTRVTAFLAPAGTQPLPVFGLPSLPANLSAFPSVTAVR